jgi:hypothetical protein
MDVIRMMPIPDGKERPAPAPVQRLGLEQSWHDAVGMGQLADVFEQDMANLPRVQAGMKVTAHRARKGLAFGLYQEARMRLIHRHIDRCIIEGLRSDGKSLSELEPFVMPGD